MKETAVLICHKVDRISILMATLLDGFFQTSSQSPIWHYKYDNKSQHQTFTLVGSGHSSRRRQTTAAPSESSRGIANIQDLTTLSHPSSAQQQNHY